MLSNAIMLSVKKLIGVSPTTASVVVSSIFDTVFSSNTTDSEKKDAGTTDLLSANRQRRLFASPFASKSISIKPFSRPGTNNI